MDTPKAAGWYPQDGLQPGQSRYWDGQQWTERVTAPKGPGSVSVGWGIVLALLIIAAVAFGALNFATQMSRT